jgi:hypothetical protein
VSWNKKGCIKVDAAKALFRQEFGGVAETRTEARPGHGAGADLGANALPDGQPHDRPASRLTKRQPFPGRLTIHSSIFPQRPESDNFQPAGCICLVRDDKTALGVRIKAERSACVYLPAWWVRMVLDQPLKQGKEAVDAIVAKSLRN